MCVLQVEVFLYYVNVRSFPHFEREQTELMDYTKVTKNTFRLNTHTPKHASEIRCIQ